MSGSREQLPSPDADLTARIRFAAAAVRLKDVARQGWVLRGVREPESVADHSWGTAVLCFLFATEAGVDRERAVTIALFHDVAEVLTGDVVARVSPTDREVSVERKAALETEAMQQLLAPGGRVFGDIDRLWSAYENRSDPAARFVRDMNLIDMCLQAAQYEREGRYDPSVMVPSEGGFTRLDEFFESAEGRLESSVARELFAVVKNDYLAARQAR